MARQIPVNRQGEHNIKSPQQQNKCLQTLSRTFVEKRLGNTEQRLYLISVWREAPNIFSEEEQVLFEMTEEIILIHLHDLSDALYEKAMQIFGEEKTAQIIMAIITINARNRIGVGLKMHPEI